MTRLHLPLLLGTLVFAVAANAGPTQKKDSEQQRQLEQTKLAVIKELAESGIEEAYFILAKLSEHRTVVTPLPDEERVHWYTLSAQTGRSSAMLWLGHYYLHGGGYEAGLENTALELLASSAILGNIQATNDLVLIPKIMAIDYAQVNSALQQAVTQLKRGTFSGCFRPTCQGDTPGHTAPPIKDAKEKAVAFEAAMHASGAENYYQYIKRIGQQKIRATLQDPSILEKRIERQNSGKIKKLERLAREQKERANPSWKLRTYLDRVAARRQGAKDTLETHKTQDLLTLEDDIRRTLKLINRHRTPDAQLRHEDILEKTGMKP